MLTLQPTTGFLVATYPPGATFGPRLLTNYELVWLIEGDAAYRYNGVEVAAPQGSVVLCRPPATDGFVWDTNRRTRHAYFHFILHGDLPPAWPAPADWPLVRCPSEGDPLRPLFGHLLTLDTAAGDPFTARLLALSLLAVFVRSGAETPMPPPAQSMPPPVERALTYIARHLDDNAAAPLSLSDLARAACVTAPHLCRLFRATTGLTPGETVRRARLARAHTLVTRTNFAVAEIAALTGFESPFHFSRAFKVQYGAAPRTLRRTQS